MHAAVAFKDLMTVREVAQHFSVSPRTIWRWVSLGRIPPPIRFTAACVRWKTADIQQLIDTLHR